MISRTGHLRASDADREQIAARLRTAATEGRIGYDELEERLGATLAARTYADLEAVVADLPRPQPPAKKTFVPLPTSPVARLALAAAIAVPMIVAALVVLTAVVSAWLVWAVAGWYVFGHHRYRRYYRRPQNAHRQAGAGSSRGFWS